MWYLNNKCYFLFGKNICQQYINALKIGKPKILSDDEMIKILEQIKNYKKG